MSSPDALPSTVGSKRERTRAALVAAALELVAEKGFAAASLDEIAARAGMTKGAIYSNFASKAELLLAAMMARGLTIETEPPAGASLADHVRAMAGGLADTLRRAKGEQALMAEFQVYALGDPELRRGLAAAYSETFARTAAYLADLPGAGDTAAARRLAVALQSIALGFLVQSLITPDEMTDAVIEETLQALADGIERRGKLG
jgi:AcrR family transcriptional regulator